MPYLQTGSQRFFSVKMWNGKVTLADSNIWLALTLSAHQFHDSATAWLQTVSGRGELLFCRSTQQWFLRLLTTSAVFRPFGNPPLTNAQAWALYERILHDPRIAFVGEPDDIERHWHRLGVLDTDSPKRWMDAYLAAFALAGRYRLITSDTAFQEFHGLDLILLRP